MDINIVSNNKYICKNDTIISDGAFSKIYDIINNRDRNNKYILKLQTLKYKYEAINEIQTLIKLNKNKAKFLNILNEKNIPYNKNNYSKLISLENYYIDNEYIYMVLPKYECTLEYFNILYNKEFKEILPINLIKKFINSLFLGLYELHSSKLIHCDIKPNNILIDLKYKNLKQFITDIKNKKIKKNDMINYIDIKIIDFNKTQKKKNIYKSTSIQILYYMAPEVIVNDKQFNESIDIWSIGVIIYELISGKYLFDIYNENKKNGNHFEYYNLNKKSKVTTDYSNSSEYSYSHDNRLEYLSLLYMYKFILGDNLYVFQNNEYYFDSKLIGDVNDNGYDNNIVDFIAENIHIEDTDFISRINQIFEKIFIYDYNNRLSADEFLTKFIF
jgi:serine/threonine protein kinase